MFTLTEPAPLFLALVASLGVAVAAWQLRSLSLSGAAAATLVGTVALKTSAAFGLYLIGWFVLASALSKAGRTRKAKRVEGVPEKGGRRDAIQVLANGGVFLLATLAMLAGASGCAWPTSCGQLLSVAAAGSLAAAGADTWATEVGTWFGGQPISVRTGTRVPVGTSGAITVAGTVAMVAGAMLLACFAALLGVIPLETPVVAAVAVGGVVGACGDTLVGAWLQERRWCEPCAQFTERSVHSCGVSTSHRAGLVGLDNDVVNAACALIGAVAAVLTVLV